MPGQSRAERAALERLCQARRGAVDAAGGLYPLFVYSYSSRGFPDLAERYAASCHLPPTYLVSLYDLHYHLHQIPKVDLSEGGTSRFLDSGGYEVHPLVDPLDLQGAPGLNPWSPDHYIAAARSHGRSGDTLVSFDHPTLSPSEQVQRGLALFDAVAPAGLRRDLLVHPNGATPGELAQAVAARSAEFDILGLTEKAIGEPWFLAAAFIQELRGHLDARLDRYVPIHVFGCLDPRTLPYLFFAGADIFDGLAWMRYYFRDCHAYYAKEIEHEVPPEALLDLGGLTRTLLAHNIEQLERLRNDLQYSVLTGDYQAFAPNLEVLLDLHPKATSIRSSPVESTAPREQHR